jgi:hypothetical protein
MSNKPVPFYTQAALLDKYIHAENPSSDPDVVEVIVNLLRTKDDLRFYFFRSNPSAAWAYILWEKGFLSYPPEPEKVENGYSLKPWDAQYFLVSVASQVPDIVIQHINTISGHGWYIARAVEALCKIPVEESEKILDRLLEWLVDPEVAEIIEKEALEYMKLLWAQNRTESALKMFDAIFAPRDLPALSRSVFGDHTKKFGSKQHPLEAFEQLKKQSPNEIFFILEKHLVNNLKKDAEKSGSPNAEFSSSWRSAIEDTDQDILDTYNDQVLCALRDTLEILVDTNQERFESIVDRYLKDSHKILQRLALYLLQIQPEVFKTKIAFELINRENIDDIDIHHEYFTLLANGFPLLSESEKESLIKLILDGPDIDEFNRIAGLIYNQTDFNREEWLSIQKKLWIRDRLWMIKEHLDDHFKKLLDELIQDSQVPDHPSFLSWMSGGFIVSDVSPFSEQDLETLSPDGLLQAVQSWRPNTDKRFGPERITYAGFANEIAKLVCSSPEKYESYLYKIAMIRSEFAIAILSRWTNPEYKNPLSWSIIINLCKNLLGNHIVWNNEKKSSYDDESWRNVRIAVARLLEVGFSNHEKVIPLDYLKEVQDLLLKLADDPDPTIEDDRPSEGWFGHNDPRTVALNHVRPIALDALIVSADFAYRDIKEDNSGAVRRLPSALRAKLEQKLNPVDEPSRAVRSVFGWRLPTLYWIDSEWTRKNLDRIFPVEKNEESIWLFASAWDSYILNKYWAKLFEVMLPKYEQAIGHVTQGYVTESHLHQTAQLAFHLLFDFLSSDYDIISRIGEKSLIFNLFDRAGPEIRSKVPWALWRILVSNPDKLSQFWPRAKMLWEWREKESAIANHSPDFNAEISEFAWLLQAAPSNESIASLRLHMDGLLPHMRNAEGHDTSWSSTEIFLARQVESEWLDAIRFYRSMCEQKLTPPRWVYHGDNAKKIIGIALAHVESRTDALALIDFFASRWKDYTFKDLYVKFSS